MSEKDIEITFVAIAEAVERTKYSERQIRRWVEEGKVRRRQHGRRIEYRLDDVLRAAGLIEPDEKDRQIARLRVELAATQGQLAEMTERAQRRQRKLNDFQERAEEQYGEYRQRIRELEVLVEQLRRELGLSESLLSGQRDQLEEREKQLAERKRRSDGLQGQIEQLTARVKAVELEQKQAKAVMSQYDQLHRDALRLIGYYAMLVSELTGRFTREDLRREAYRLQQLGRELDARGGMIRRSMARVGE